MKKILSILVTLFAVSFLAQAQPETKMVHELDRKTDLLLDTAAKHMIQFILTKDETEYTKAMANAKEAQSVNVRLDSLAKTAGIAYAKEIEKYVALNIIELQDYDDTTIKQTVLNDKATDEHVMFKRKKYLMGKPTKALFNKFIQYLPAN